MHAHSNAQPTVHVIITTTFSGGVSRPDRLRETVSLTIFRCWFKKSKSAMTQSSSVTYGGRYYGVESILGERYRCSPFPLELLPPPGDMIFGQTSFSVRCPQTIPSHASSSCTSSRKHFKFPWIFPHKTNTDYYNGFTTPCRELPGSLSQQQKQHIPALIFHVPLDRDQLCLCRMFHVRISRAPYANSAVG